MRFCLGHNALPDGLRGPVVTIGMFDGVHRAHQRLIRAAVRLARRRKTASVALTFHPDPERVLRARSVTSPLMSLERRAELIGALGIDVVWVIPFTRGFARLSAESFLEQLIRRRLRAAAVVVGDAFAFGRGRRGDVTLLRAYGRRHGLRVLTVPTMMLDGQRVSSSRVKRLVAAGRLHSAARLLGRPVELGGVVVRGRGLGRRLGFPTANLRLDPQALPPSGVYAVQAVALARRHRGVMNFGVRPTFGGGPLTCEVHLLDDAPRLLGRRLRVELHATLRRERRFAAPSLLASQIARDIVRAKHLLKHLQVR